MDHDDGLSYGQVPPLLDPCGIPGMTHLPESLKNPVLHALDHVIPVPERLQVIRMPRLPPALVSPPVEETDRLDVVENPVLLPFPVVLPRH